MRKENGYYLSEATREVEFQYGYFNSIIAPVGSGKTTYTGNKLQQEVKCDGLYIYLAPYNMLEDQVVAEGLFDRATERHKIAMQGFILFDGRYTTEDILELESSKIAMTPHKFFRMVLEYPQIMDRVSMLVIDESDHVFCRLPQWERQDIKMKEENKVFDKIKDIILEHLDNVMVIGITATGEDNLRNEFGDYYNGITFKEDLRRYKPKSCIEYSDIKLAFSDAKKHDGKVAVFTESVRNMLAQRQYLESIGYSVDMIVSDFAENYRMNDREKQIKEQLATTGKSDLIGDILLFNSAMERGISIHDKNFKSIIIHSSNKDTQIQVLGRFRFNGMKVWKLLPDYLRDRADRVPVIVDSKTGEVSSKIEAPDKYLDIPLTSEMKSELIEDIGFNRGWTILKRELIDAGYEVKEHTKNINKKRTRVSSISK